MAYDNSSKGEPLKGLKKLRNNPHAELVLCTNCNCKRYGPCGCEKKGGGKKAAAQEA